MTPWDPDVYARFAAERDRPFHELVARVPLVPRHVVDLGCGDGRLTRTLVARWPEAEVVGVDSSAAMLERARRDAGPEVRFEATDLATWRSTVPLDLIVSNAALHWVADHPALLRRLCGSLRSGGVLAVQVPMNHAAPSHLAVQEVARSAAWRDRFVGLGAVHVLPPEKYVQVLRDLGCTVDLWTTTYHHVLPRNGVLQWLEGTTLRPYLARLSVDEAQRFLEELAARIDAAYPVHGDHVVFPFTRLFFVATLP